MSGLMFVGAAACLCRIPNGIQNLIVSEAGWLLPVTVARLPGRLWSCFKISPKLGKPV